MSRGVMLVCEFIDDGLGSVGWVSASDPSRHRVRITGGGEMSKAATTPRSISPEELAVIAQAVRLGAINGSELPSLDRLASLRVVGKCDCGCASVEFEQLGTGQAPSLVADAIGDTPGGKASSFSLKRGDSAYLATREE